MIRIIRLIVEEFILYIIYIHISQRERFFKVEICLWQTLVFILRSMNNNIIYRLFINSGKSGHVSWHGTCPILQTFLHFLAVWFLLFHMCTTPRDTTFIFYFHLKFPERRVPKMVYFDIIARWQVHFRCTLTMCI